MHKIIVEDKIHDNINHKEVLDSIRKLQLPLL